MHRQRNNQLLLQPGFRFPERAVKLSDNPEENTLLKQALLGPTHESKDASTIRCRTKSLLQELFDLCLDYELLGRALRLDDIFWGTIAERWNTLVHLNGQQTKKIAGQYVEARREAIRQGWTTKNELTTSVDKFILFQDEVEVLPTVEESSLAVRPTAINQATENLGQLSVQQPPDSKPRVNAWQLGLDFFRLHTNPLPPPPIETEWPPTYLSGEELAWVSDTRLESHLSGISYQKLPEGCKFPRHFPSNKSTPLDIKAFLCATALHSKRRDLCSWGLYMKPIAFASDNDAQGWWGPTGRLSREYDTIQQFAAWAKQRMDSRPSTMYSAIGLISSWPGENLDEWRSWTQVETLAAKQNLWLEISFKFSFVVVMNKRSDGYRLTVYDPGHELCADHKPQAGQVEPPEWTFKRRMCNEINKILPIKHLFHGGEYCKIKDADGNEGRDLLGSSVRYVASLLRGDPRFAPNPRSSQLLGMEDNPFTEIRAIEDYLNGGELPEHPDDV
ncbi:hypothetical protein GGR57DRAFT_320481 [Xylariaceae sp. FL1272]|nr:hypothetical protein GGR57DRAFT_320481 [Xylariaceae sp. FL1272]